MARGERYALPWDRQSCSGGIRRFSRRGAAEIVSTKDSRGRYMDDFGGNVSGILRKVYILALWIEKTKTSNKRNSIKNCEAMYGCKSCS